MTVATTIIGNRIQVIREIKLDTLDNERTALALEIEEFFYDKKQITNVTMNQSLANAIRDLINATNSISRTSSELNKSVKEMPKYKELLSEIKKIKINFTDRFKSSN